MKAKSNSTLVGQESIDPNRDYWGQPVEAPDTETGAGEQCECQNCGVETIACIGGTDPKQADSDNFEEFYHCLNCGVEGSFRVEGSNRHWTGMIRPVEGDR